MVSYKYRVLVLRSGGKAKEFEGEGGGAQSRYYITSRGGACLSPVLSLVGRKEGVVRGSRQYSSNLVYLCGCAVRAILFRGGLSSRGTCEELRDSS